MTLSELGILGGPKTRAFWLDENVFRAGPKGVDDAVEAIKKIRRNANALNQAAEELREKYR